jgi:hypothetical protein
MVFVKKLTLPVSSKVPLVINAGLSSCSEPKRDVAILITHRSFFMGYANLVALKII